MVVGVVISLVVFESVLVKWIVVEEMGVVGEEVGGGTIEEFVNSDVNLKVAVEAVVEIGGIKVDIVEDTEVVEVVDIVVSLVNELASIDVVVFDTTEEVVAMGGLVFDLAGDVLFVEDGKRVIFFNTVFEVRIGRLVVDLADDVLFVEDGKRVEFFKTVLQVVKVLVNVIEELLIIVDIAVRLDVDIKGVLEVGEKAFDELALV